MKRKYVHSEKNTQKKSKHGIDLSIFDTDGSGVGVVGVSVEKGHLQEFYSMVSYFIYRITDGFGTFVLDDEKQEVAAGDLVVIPPKTRIHYFGKMKMTLVTSPSFKAEDEVHVRFVDESESPYL